MKRREFIKNSICLGCAGAIGANFALGNNYYIPTQQDLEKFMYKSEAELPKKIRLEACNLCQLDCVKCWMRTDEELIKTKYGGFGYVDFQTFKNFVDRHPFIEELELAINGEIFLNPDLDKIIKYAYEKNIKLYAFGGVNLNTLSEQTAEYLVKYKFTQMTVSIDGATPETYAIYRCGGDFNKVIENIKMINKFKKKYREKRPYLTYKFILFGHNEHEIEDAKKLAKKLDMKIVFDKNIFPEYSPVIDKERVKKLTGVDLDTNYMDDFYGTQWFFCRQLFTYPQVNYNGDLFGCCCTHLESFKINVFEEGLLKALNNEKVLYAKQMLTNLATKPREDLPCSNCFIYHYSKSKNYELKLD